MIAGIPGWAFWSIAAAALAIGEVFTPGLFFLGPIALAALAAAVVAAVATGAVAPLVVFVAASLLSLLLLRPLVRRHVSLPATSRTGTAALIGTKAIGTVFQAIHEGDADPKLLAYQYLQMLPQIAQGTANKLWLIPTEFSEALARVGAPAAEAGGNGKLPLPSPAQLQA